jgi:hypothetical protein
MRKHSVVAVLAIAVVVSGPVAAAAKGPKAKRASVKQIARLVSDAQPGILELIPQVRSDCTEQNVLSGVCGFDESRHQQHLLERVLFLEDELKDADKRRAGNRRYLGRLPERITALVKHTIQSLGDVFKTYVDLSNCLIEHDPMVQGASAAAQCSPVMADAALTKLESNLNSWEPYIDAKKKKQKATTTVSAG